MGAGSQAGKQDGSGHRGRRQALAQDELAGGVRSTEVQRELMLKGEDNLDGISPKAHEKFPGDRSGGKNMTDHEFFILEDEKIVDKPLWFSDRSMIKTSVLLPDKLVSDNGLFLKGFKSFKCSFKNPGEGLDYGGITLIPHTSLECFINNLKELNSWKIIPESTVKSEDGEIFAIKAVKITSKMHAQLSQLIGLCESAKEEKKYIVHFGL